MGYTPGLDISCPVSKALSTVLGRVDNRQELFAATIHVQRMDRCAVICRDGVSPQPSTEHSVPETVCKYF